MFVPESWKNLEVRNIISSPVPEIYADMSVKEAADFLLGERLPATMVFNRDGELVGYIEIYDLVKALLDGKENVKLSKYVKKPIPIVKADRKVIDVMRIFTIRNTPIIAVTYKGRITGYLTIIDMLRVLPEIVESLLAMEEFEEKPVFKLKAPVMGYCDRCGTWSDRLIEVDGNYYCPDCIADLFGESIR
ncbi:hypothetical protein DRN87_00105 [Candidatus Geothermarchaeota archaeon]|nr:MAG: hypothetical protein DRN87_00105 [Candidatus Geothermarchaeota archaeon]